MDVPYTKDTGLNADNISSADMSVNNKDDFLDEVALGRANVINAASSLIQNNIGLVKYCGDRAFTICDYGTLDGMTSMAIMNECIAFIKSAYGQDTEVSVLYEDLPGNDFTMLLQKINGGDNGHATYMTKYDDVFAAAIGTSFYRQCVPSHTIHLGFTAGAVHFLQARPCRLTGTMHHTRVTDEMEKQQFAAQAAADWEKFLLLRAREMLPGGRLVIATMGRDKHGQSTGQTNNIKECMFAQLDDVWRQMLDEGRITQREYEEMTFGEYFRDEEESIAPMMDVASPVYKAGLRLVSVESRVIRCVYHTRWMKEGKTDDAEARRAHANRYIKKMRSWADGHMLPCLDSERSHKEKVAILDQLFEAYEARVASAPEDHGMDYVSLYLCIEKTEHNN